MKKGLRIASTLAALAWTLLGNLMSAVVRVVGFLSDTRESGGDEEKRTASPMSDPEETLIGRHNYRTQKIDDGTDPHGWYDLG